VWRRPRRGQCRALAGGLRPALTPAAGHAHRRPPGARPREKIRQIQVSTVSGDCRECFFSIITRQAIRRGTFTSVADLTAAIETYIDGWNENAEPFTWTKPADEHIDKINRAKTKTSDLTVH
jgi:hypothetical protein